VTLSPTSPFSPFGRNVGVAYLVGEPLRRHNRATSLALGETLSGRTGNFMLTASANFLHRVGRTQSDRDYDLTALQAAVGAGTISPFAPIDPALLGRLRTELSKSRSDNGNFRATASGPVFKLPTGQVRISTRSSLCSESQRK